MPREDQLFAWPPPRRRRRPKPAFVRVDDDPRWRALAGVRGVDRFAHLITDDPPRFAIAHYSLCGLAGRAMSLQNTKPAACPKCLQLRDNHQGGTRHAK